MTRNGLARRRTLSLALVAALSGLFAGAAAPSLEGVGAAAAATARQAIPFTRAEVESADGRRFTISWSAPAAAGPIEIYARASADPAAPGEARKVGRGGASGRIEAVDMPPAARWYFELRPRHGQPLIVADRSLHLPTAPNFRDVGGYRTADGHWVRMGLIYRSDQLDRLSDADLATIGHLAPSLVVDLRTASERKSGPDRAPPAATLLVADVMASSPPNIAALMQATEPDAGARFMETLNQQFVSLPSALRSYGALLAKVPDPSGPVVYHCTAGKDRTGWATAVLLTALGVPRDTVMADYLASNGYLTEKNKATAARIPPATAAKLEPVLTVRASYLEASFQEVERRYGSFDRYLKEGLGVDDAALAALRSRMLAGS